MTEHLAGSGVSNIATIPDTFTQRLKLSDREVYIPFALLRLDRSDYRFDH
jgi:hypothetical protein